jgi:hypothetical protein
MRHRRSKTECPLGLVGICRIDVLLCRKTAPTPAPDEQKLTEGLHRSGSNPWEGQWLHDRWESAFSSRSWGRSSCASLLYAQERTRTSLQGFYNGFSGPERAKMPDRQSADARRSPRSVHSACHFCPRAGALDKEILRESGLTVLQRGQEVPSCYWQLQCPPSAEWGRFMAS